MVRDNKFLKEWEREWIRKEQLSVEDKFKIFETLLETAVALGAWPLKNPLDGIEKDIELAKRINAHVSPFEKISSEAG